MPLNSQAKAMVDMLVEMLPMDYSTATVQQFRTASLLPPAVDAQLSAVENRSIPGGDDTLAIRVYRPIGPTPHPVTVFFHGGGFVSGDLDSHDNLCRLLAAKSQSIFVAIAYRLAPEAPFPAAIEDALTALHWVEDNAASFGGDATRIAVAGDSAGGNIAAVAAQLSRDQGPKLCHQLLLSPVTDCSFDSPTYHTYGKGHFLTTEMMQWFWRLYLPSAAAAEDVRASPLRARDHTGLPSATVFTGECDPLCSEGEAYARALTAAGVPVEYKCWDGQIHDFISMIGAIDDAMRAIDEASASLRKAFAGPS